MTHTPKLISSGDSKDCWFLECAVTSFASSRISFSDVNALRKSPQKLIGNFGNAVRHCDEQTLAVMATVFDAINRFESKPTSFEGWGVVCSSRYLGRSAFTQSLGKFAVEGPWNVSIQVVPNRSLHSPASTVGLALGCHGPCVGVGGGLDGEVDAWLTAATLMQQHSLPGVWMCFSGWEPETPIDINGNLLGETRCTALVIALQPVEPKTGGLRLRLGYDLSAPHEIEVPARSTAISLFEQFVSNEQPSAVMTAMIGGGVRVEIDRPNAAESTIPLSSTSTSRSKAA